MGVYEDEIDYERKRRRALRKRRRVTPQDRRTISDSSANDLLDLSRCDLRACLRVRCLASSIANNRRWCAVRALELRRGCCSSFRMTAFAAFCTTFAMAAHFFMRPGASRCSRTR